jgi:hypothetical protein
MTSHIIIEDVFERDYLDGKWKDLDYVITATNHAIEFKGCPCALVAS